MKKYFPALICLLLLSSSLFAAQERSSYPLLSGDTFKEYCDVIIDETTKEVKASKVPANSIIFVRTEFLPKFFQEYHKALPPYILVTHNSPLSIPGQFKSYLGEKKLIAWFGVNVENCTHPKLHPIPIGLANRFNSKGGNTQLIKSYRKQLDSFEKKHLVYMGFQKSSTPQERNVVYDLFRNKDYCFFSHETKYIKVYHNVVSSKFTFCPRVNSLDTHRIWEALYLGSIPIVKTSSIDAVYEKLPVLIVDDWKIIDQEYLEAKLQEITDAKHEMDRLEADYWFKKIRSLKPGSLYFRPKN